MAKVADPKQVKSAKRVLELFEYFNDTRRTATVMEIAREYGYPQSSTSELLSCLVELGFLRHDRYSRTYRPTARVAALGAWVHPRLFRQGGLLHVMDSIAQETGSAVVLGGMVGLSVQFFHQVGARHAPPAQSLTSGPMGRLLLGTYDRIYIRKLVHRLNSEAESVSDRVACEDLLIDIEQIRRQGYAVSSGVPEGAVGSCCVLLPQSAADEPLALGVEIRPGDQRGSDYYVRALLNGISSDLGPVLAHHQADGSPPMRCYS